MSDLSPSITAGSRTLCLPVIALLTLLVVVFVLGIMLGTPALSWSGLVDVLFTDAGEEIERMVVREIRIPRFVLGLLVGSLLGAAGTLMQH